MTSKIDALPPSLVPPTATSARHASTTGKVDATDASPAIGTPQDSIALSTSRRADGETPIDHARVAKVRAAVLDGSYTVDAANIADRLVDLEKNLP